jgi:hypothetical protein
VNTIPPAAGPNPSSPFAPAPPVPEPPVHLTRLLLSLALTVLVFDFCFWNVNGMGLSVAVFVLVFAGIILGNREVGARSRSTFLLLMLFAGAVLATAIETSVTNTLVLLMLTLAVAGDTFFHDLGSASGRWLSQAAAWICAPERPFWLGARVVEAAFDRGLGWAGGIVGGCLLAVPALVLTLLFGTLLASGNVVFGTWTNSFFDWFWKEFVLYLNPGRVCLWFVVAFLVLPLLRPARISPAWWSWTQRLPRLPELVPNRASTLSSGLVLVALNLLFFIANLADALFLWSGQPLPSGLTYSQFVHNGVNSLTITGVLSALVLTAIFQQTLAVAQRRELKALAVLWIAQNLFLLVSVTLRLRSYIEAYDMTVARLGALIFLVLVAAGYALLTLKIIKDKSLSWLIGGCVLAVFANFYITQFLDLAGLSANYNVARWEKNPQRQLDGAYLGRLGPAAWPSIHRAYYGNSRFDSEAYDALHTMLRKEEETPKSHFDLAHWREFSLRAWWNRGALDEKPK